jgi:hypothetical protein
LQPLLAGVLLVGERIPGRPGVRPDQQIQELGTSDED